LAAGWVLRGDARPWFLHVWTIDCLGYFEPQARALRNFDLPGYLFAWQGLHPPAAGWIHGAMMAAGLGLPLQWAATRAASLGAALLLGVLAWRRGGGALALLLTLLWAALSPMQATYGLSLNPYPWALLLFAVSTFLALRATDAGAGTSVLLAAGLASATLSQTHILGAAAAAAQAAVLGLLLRRRWRVLLPYAAPLAASLAVAAAASLLKTRDPWTFHVGQPDRGWPWQAWLVLSTRFGPLAERVPWMVSLGLGLLLSLRRSTRICSIFLLIPAVAWLAALSAFLSMGVADSRLTHYFTTPQLAVLAAAALGWGGLATSVRRPALTWALALTPLLASIPWARSAVRWHEERRSAGQELRPADAAAAERLRDLYSQAGPGDVVAWLWDASFINDEPEHRDALAASAWPARRLGVPCFSVDSPRALCQASSGAQFYFAPDAYWGSLRDVEEPMRLMVEEARAPGRAVFVQLPGPEAPPRPWPVDAWLLAHGATLLEASPSVRIWTFPPGARIPAPAPVGDPD
jgi:hypothetical protein